MFLDALSDVLQRYVKAISNVEQALNNNSLEKELCFEIVYLSDNLYESLSYADSEGIIKGTLIDIYKKLVCVLKS